MKTMPRIPKLRGVSFDGALTWFSEMRSQHFLFHPEDAPSEIIRTPDGVRLFFDRKATELQFLIGEPNTNLGRERVIEAAYPIFMNACRMKLDA